MRCLAVGLALCTWFACANDDPSSVPPTSVPPPLPAPRAGYYADPVGRPAWDGSPTHPWDLATALSGGNGRIRPGDTLWLRGGTYRGHFVSDLSGAPGASVVIRQWPGERAIIDGVGTPANVSVLHVRGDWTEFRDFEITNSAPGRVTMRPDVVANYASHTEYINLVIHDGGVAFYTDRRAADVEVTGSVIYNNGWDEPDRGHGHGVYIKSDVGPVVVRDNVIFNQFGYGIHAYSDTAAGWLNNILVERNVVFNNGAPSAKPSYSGNVLVGGWESADQVTLVGNIAYYSPGIRSRNVQAGFRTVLNGTVALTDNYLVNGSTVLDVGFWLAATVSGNTLIGDGTMQTLHNPATLGAVWSDNHYHHDPADSAWGFAGVEYPFALWQSTTGLGGTDEATSEPLVYTKVVVLANPYEAGRATIVVCNWGQDSGIPVDLSGVLAPGDRYEVRNVQALFDPPLAVGTYDGGSVVLPLDGVAPPVPVGLAASPAPRTGPAFDVFVVTRPAP